MQDLINAHLVELVAAGHADDGDIAVITPHRAQRTLLTRHLDAHIGGAVDVVDTVERLQGGERRVVIVSGTASEPNAIGASAEFLLNLNRSNVAFSRSQDRLIVVCARTLLDHVGHTDGAGNWIAANSRADLSEGIALLSDSPGQRLDGLID